MSNQGAPTTAPSNIDPSIAGLGPPPAGQVGGAIPEPVPIGVGKYQTVGGQFVFQGTKYQRVIRGSDGKYYAVDSFGSVLTDPKTGKEIEDQPVVDRSGSPIRLQATYATPLTQATHPASTNPQEMAAASLASTGGVTGPARYNEGDDSAIWYSLPSEERAQVMQAMVDAGLSPSTGSTSGLDQSWVSQFKQVLAFSNANNLEWDKALSVMPAADRTSTQLVKPSNVNVQLDSPQDLAAIFKKAAASVIGGGAVPQSDIDNYVRAYQELQRQDAETQARQQDIANAVPKQRIQVDENGNPVTPTTHPSPTNPQEMAAASTDQPTSALPPTTVTESTALASPQQVAQDYLKQHFPARYNATNMANAGNMLLNSMSRLGQAPSTVGGA